MKSDSNPTAKKHIEKIVTQDTGPEYETDEFGSRFPTYEEKEWEMMKKKKIRNLIS